MEAKDTVMSANNIATLGFGQYTDKNMVLYGMEIPKVLEKQAEISYQAGLQAGRKEVVESFVSKVKHHSDPELRRRAFEEVLFLLVELS